MINNRRLYGVKGLIIISLLLFIFFSCSVNKVSAETDVVEEIDAMEEEVYQELKGLGLSDQDISREMLKIEQRIKSKGNDGVEILKEAYKLKIEIKGEAPKRNRILSGLFDSDDEKKGSKGQAASDDGILAEGDVLQIEVDNHSEFNTITSIGTDGQIRLHLVGEIEARGLTLAELKDNLVKRLSEYVRRPKVSVRTKKDITGGGDISFSYTVYLFGEVPRPGSYTVTGKTNVVQLIALAGGLSQGQGSGDVFSTVNALGVGGGISKTRTAGSDLSRVTVIRQDGKVSWVNVNRLLKTGVGSEDIGLRPGDTVYISPASFQNIDILGEVILPGSYALAQGQNVSLLDAIALAKGLTEDAAIHNIKVINKLNKDKYKTIVVNLKKAILKGGDIPVMPTLGAGDTVFVSRTRLYHWKRLFAWISTTAGASTSLNSWMDLKLKLQSIEDKDRASRTYMTYDGEGRLIKSETVENGDLPSS